LSLFFLLKSLQDYPISALAFIPTVHLFPWDTIQNVYIVEYDEKQNSFVAEVGM
jgi:hypothetical protein